MQASLPKFVRMVSVDDIGQGSEPLRILGVKWLPRAAAKKSVSSKGDLEKTPKQTRKQTGIQDGEDDTSQDVNSRELRPTEQDEEEVQNTNVSPGMEAEEGDFINLEIAFAYKTSRSRRKYRDRSKNMHLYLAFYLPGNIKLREWIGVAVLSNADQSYSYLC